MYITDKNKYIKNYNVNHKNPTPSISLIKPSRVVVWYPFPYRFFKTVKGLGFFLIL